MPFCVFGRKVDASPSSFLSCVGTRRRSKDLQKQADELYKATKERQDEEKRASSERERQSSIESERQSQEDRITKMVASDELEEDSVSCSSPRTMINGVVLERSASRELSEAMVGMRQSIVGARGELNEFQARMMTEAQKEARAEAEAEAELQANPAANVLAKGWSKEADAKATAQVEAQAKGMGLSAMHPIEKEEKLKLIADEKQRRAAETELKAAMPSVLRPAADPERLETAIAMARVSGVATHKLSEAEAKLQELKALQQQAATSNGRRRRRTRTPEDAAAVIQSVQRGHSVRKTVGFLPGVAAYEGHCDPGEGEGGSKRRHKRRDSSAAGSAASSDRCTPSSSSGHRRKSSASSASSVV